MKLNIVLREIRIKQDTILVGIILAKIKRLLISTLSEGTEQRILSYTTGEKIID